ncbi:dystonin [Caerostris extrusa]|uniref:Dystonin n=1 Tax=Caerostris extrusa TaxID=172846 RepID=A0AAV4SV43_CAEEX|nr:dystonin [Caerostris extrusa]
MINPNDAVADGWIDSETAHKLNVISNKMSSEKNSLINKNTESDYKCDFMDSGKIPDFNKGIFVSIREALNNELVDKNTGKLLVPVGRALSLDEAYNQGLINEELNKVIHPESGAALTIEEGYIDVESKEYIRPHSNERISIQKAFDNFELLIIPVQPQREYFLLDDALNKMLICPKNLTFQHPVSEEKN